MLPLYSEVVGEMANACEKFDHSEKFPSWAVLERSVCVMAMIAVGCAEAEDIDLIKSVQERWKIVEAKFAAQAAVSSKSKKPTASVAA